MKLTLTIVALLLGTPTLANTIEVRFLDGAPKDRITLTNSGCPVFDLTLTLDLTGTPAGLIFDVTADGAGVEVFQPVEVAAGQISILPVTDGDQVLSLHIPEFPPQSEMTLTADLDDTTSTRQITVDGTEMVGAVARISLGDGTAAAAFQIDGSATLDLATAGHTCPQA